MPKVRITVLKTMLHQDPVDDYIRHEALKKSFGACLIFEEGQAFISERWPSKPEGFCERAWPNIPHEVSRVMYGASAPWIEDPGYTITCCNDGLRPVIFKVERIADEVTA